MKLYLSVCVWSTLSVSEILFKSGCEKFYSLFPKMFWEFKTWLLTHSPLNHSMCPLCHRRLRGIQQSSTVSSLLPVRSVCLSVHRTDNCAPISSSLTLPFSRSEFSIYCWLPHSLKSITFCENLGRLWFRGVMGGELEI